MRICAAQIQPLRGDIAANIGSHKEAISLAVSLKVDALFFPELSLTGYEPGLAQSLAMDEWDVRFDDFQKICNHQDMMIGLGAPTRSGEGICISMILFQPGMDRQTYSKQQLHADEVPYFVPGPAQVMITHNGVKMAPAICYESLQVAHAENAKFLGAEIYVASVAKPQSGVHKALKHFPAIATKHTMTVLMSNCIGLCDNFEGAGQSAVWNRRGELAGQLNDREGLLVFDTLTEEVIKESL
jgi:predicted amidohydrolase